MSPIPFEVREMASLLEAGCVALAFQERMHSVIGHAHKAVPAGSMSVLLGVPPEARVKLPQALKDALVRADLAAAAATATCMRQDHPRQPALFLASAAESLLQMHPQESAALGQRATRARRDVGAKTDMASIAGCIMESLSACRHLARLAMDNGSPLDADVVIDQYESQSAELFREAEHALCRGFGVSRAQLPDMSHEIARIELCRRLAFMAYDLCFKDGLIQAAARERFEALTEQASALTARQHGRGGMSLQDAMTDAERQAHAARSARLAAAGFQHLPPLSGRVVLMAAPKVPASGSAVESLTLIRRSADLATRSANEFISTLEGGQPAFELAAFLPLHVDPETPSVSLRDSLARAVHGAGRAALQAGDVLCIARHADRSEDGPDSMLASREAGQLCDRLRRAGVLVLVAEPSREEPSAFAAQCDALADNPKQLATLAKSLVEQHRLEETASLRLLASRRAATLKA